MRTCSFLSSENKYLNTICLLLGIQHPTSCGASVAPISEHGSHVGITDRTELQFIEFVQLLIPNGVEFIPNFIKFRFLVRMLLAGTRTHTRTWGYVSLWRNWILISCSCVIHKETCWLIQESTRKLKEILTISFLGTDATEQSRFVKLVVTTFSCVTASYPEHAVVKDKANLSVHFPLFVNILGTSARNVSWFRQTTCFKFDLCHFCTLFYNHCCWVQIQFQQYWIFGCPGCSDWSTH
jgi:hypothetical protein